MEVRPKYFRVMGSTVWVIELITIILLTIRSALLLINTNDVFKIIISFLSVVVTFIVGTALGFLFYAQASDLEGWE